MSQETSKPTSSTAATLLGGLGVDQLRSLIDSLNLLAEQEEDRVLWEQVGPTPPLGSPESVSPEGGSPEPRSPERKGKAPLKEPSSPPGPESQYKAMSVSPEPGQKPAEHGAGHHSGAKAEQSSAAGQGTWSQGSGQGFNPNGGKGGSGGGCGCGGNGGCGGGPARPGRSGGSGGGGGGPARPGPSDGVGPEGGECSGVRWYCITRGRAVGVFTGWNNVSPLVTGVHNAIYARYPTFSTALDAFLDASAGGHVFIVL